MTSRIMAKAISYVKSTQQEHFSGGSSIYSIVCVFTVSSVLEKAFFILLVCVRMYKCYISFIQVWYTDIFIYIYIYCLSYMILVFKIRISFVRGQRYLPQDMSLFPKSPLAITAASRHAHTRRPCRATTNTLTRKGKKERAPLKTPTKTKTKAATRTTRTPSGNRSCRT